MDARVARIGRLVARRALEAVPLLVAISAVAFVLLQLVPGGPVDAYLANPGVRPEDLERLRRSLGLDRPLPVQYASWLAAFVRGDWGYSYSDGRPVLTRVAERLPASAELLTTAVVLALAWTVPASVVAALKRGRPVAAIVNVLAGIGVSVPSFWLGLMLQMTLAVGLGWLPTSGRSVDGGLLDRLSFLVMPAFVLAFVLASGWTRYLRLSLVQVLSAPFVAAAHARGVPVRAGVLRHALPNAVAPVAAAALLDVALLVPGAVVTESVFAWPGVGSLFTEALGRRDYPVLMAMLMASSTAVIAFNLLADAMHAWIDPRVTV